MINNGKWRYTSNEGFIVCFIECFIDPTGEQGESEHMRKCTRERSIDIL